MHSNLTDKELEAYLSGEYTGRIYSVSKFMPVLNVLREKGDISPDLIGRLAERLSKSKDSFIYFDAKTAILFGLRFSLNTREGLSLDVIKLQNNSETEIRKFCASLFQIIPLKRINIIEEKEVAGKEKDSVKIAV